MNQSEVNDLSAGATIQEKVHFPGGNHLVYSLEPFSGPEPVVTFDGKAIRVSIPYPVFTAWAHKEDIGLYFDFPAGSATLTVKIEKDLECLHGPEEEKDPEAFPRSVTH